MIRDGDGNGILRKNGYACLCLCVCATTLATWKRGRVFDRVLFLGTLKNCRQSFLFSGNARILFKTTAMERLFYSIISSCLIEFLASRSLTLSISVVSNRIHAFPEKRNKNWRTIF